MSYLMNIPLFICTTMKNNLMTTHKKISLIFKLILHMSVLMVTCSCMNKLKAEMVIRVTTQGGLLEHVEHKLT